MSTIKMTFSNNFTNRGYKLSSTALIVFFKKKSKIEKPNILL